MVEVSWQGKTRKRCGHSPLWGRKEAVQLTVPAQEQPVQAYGRGQGEGRDPRIRDSVRAWGWERWWGGIGDAGSLESGFRIQG